MIRKNLILIIIKNYDGINEMYLSNYIPGCLDWDEYINKITNFINIGTPKNAIQNLTLLRLNSKIIFNRVNNFSFNPSKNDNKLDIIDNLYIINTTKEYVDIECKPTVYIDKYYKENGFISCPETISCFSLGSTTKKLIEYEIKSINYKAVLNV